MKILLISNLFPPEAMDGYHRGARQVADALTARGHDLRVLTSIPRSPVPTAPNVRRTLRLGDAWRPHLFEYSTPVTNHLAQSKSDRINSENIHILLDELGVFQPDVVYAWMLTGLGDRGSWTRSPCAACPGRGT